MCFLISWVKSMAGSCSNYICNFLKKIPSCFQNASWLSLGISVFLFSNLSQVCRGTSVQLFLYWMVLLNTFIMCLYIIHISSVVKWMFKASVNFSVVTKYFLSYIISNFICKVWLDFWQRPPHQLLLLWMMLSMVLYLRNFNMFPIHKDLSLKIWGFFFLLHVIPLRWNEKAMPQQHSMICFQLIFVYCKQYALKPFLNLAI